MKSALIFLALLPAMLAGRPAAAQMFAGYDEFCRVPVIIVPNPQGASAARDNFGNPVIFIDPSVMMNWTASRVFFLAHECGHHSLGHSLPQGMWFRHTQYWATRRQELEADCWAARQLAQIGYHDDVRRMIRQFVSMGPAPQGTYPSGHDRARTVARCAGIDSR